MLTDKKVLVVDDDTLNLQLMNGLLEDQSQAFCVTSAHAAYAQIEDNKSDIILLDIEMPEIDG